LSQLKLSKRDELTLLLLFSLLVVKPEGGAERKSVSESKENGRENISLRVALI